MGGVILAIGLVTAFAAICVTLPVAAMWPDPEDARNSRAAALYHILYEVIEDNLYCATCASAVDTSNCTGWDEDGNVWDDCQGKVPLIDDISWKPTRSQGGEDE